MKQSIFKKELPKIVVDIQKEELQKMINEQSILEVSKKLKISRRKLLRYLRENDFIIMSSKQKSITKRKFNVEKEELVKLMNALPMTKIGEMFGVSDKAVYKRAKLFGIFN